jgi:hypothetical protein
VRDVLADLAVAARRTPLEHAVAVHERDGEPVDLGLGHEAEARVPDPLARQVRPHARHPHPQLLLRARVRERQHRLQVADLLELGDGLGAHALCGRVRRAQLRVLGLDPPQLVEQRVVRVVPDDRVVEDVVAVVVLGQLAAQLHRAVGRGRHSAISSAAGASSRARS